MTALGKRFTIGLLVSGGCFSCLVLSIARGPGEFELGYTTELYALQARSFLAGKTALPVEPRPELLSLQNPYDPKANGSYRLHDASLYRGRYYLYFGPVPVVILFAPYRLLTHLDLPNRVAIPILCIGGYLSSCALFFLLSRHNRWELPFWLQCAIVVSLCSMSLVAMLLRRPRFYEVAIAAGYFFVMAGFLALAKALFESGDSRRWLLFAGLLFGLSVGCRPHLVVVCAIVLVTFAIHPKRRLRQVMPLAALMAATGIVLAWYNYARFGNPLEFGVTYQLSAFSHSQHNIEGTLRAAYKLLFAMPGIDAEFPFFHAKAVNPLPGSGTAIWTEDMAGLVPAASFALLGFFAPLFLRKRLSNQLALDRASSWLLFSIYWSGVAVFLVLCLTGWVTGRYLVDFAPLLTFEGAVVIVLLWQRFRERRAANVLRWAISAAAIFGVVINAALATPRLDRIIAVFSR